LGTGRKKPKGGHDESHNRHGHHRALIVKAFINNRNLSRKRGKGLENEIEHADYRTIWGGKGELGVLQEIDNRESLSRDDESFKVLP